MIAYLDTSIILRIALNEKDPLKEFRQIQRGVTSRLLKAESLRSLDRLRTNNKIDSDAYAAALEFVYEVLDYLEIINLSEIVLERVGEPTGLNLGTLDAIHLFSATLWRVEKKLNPVFLTHDLMLGRAAQFLGFQVLGV